MTETVNPPSIPHDYNMRYANTSSLYAWGAFDVTELFLIAQTWTVFPWCCPRGCWFSFSLPLSNVAHFCQVAHEDGNQLWGQSWDLWSQQTQKPSRVNPKSFEGNSKDTPPFSTVTPNPPGLPVAGFLEMRKNQEPHWGEHLFYLASLSIGMVFWKARWSASIDEAADLLLGMLV